jgi:hypothetical protein
MKGLKERAATNGDASSILLFFVWAMPATTTATRRARTQVFFRKDDEASFHVVVFTFHEWRRSGSSW